MISHRKSRQELLLEDYRYEIKVPLDINQYNELRQNLYQIGIYPRRIYETRLISSIYLDSPDFFDYQDNIAGIGQRRKTRIRWYDEDIGNLVLERKIKSNKASRKELFPLTNPNLIIPDTPSKLKSIMDSNSNINVRILSEPLAPFLEVQYKREYFMLETNLRMTIDVDQKFKRLTPSVQSKHTRSPVYSVAEFKFPALDRVRVQQILQGLPFRVFRHSKYVIGTEVVSS